MGSGKGARGLRLALLGDVTPVRKNTGTGMPIDRMPLTMKIS
jgi:hypothetical protein